MRLEDLIDELEKYDLENVVRFGFANPHSYRGYYHELAFEPANNVSVGDMLAAAEGALNFTFEGYKGGEFTMDADTQCWLAYEGTCSDSDEIITPLILGAMFIHTVK